MSSAAARGYIVAVAAAVVVLILHNPLEAAVVERPDHNPQVEEAMRGACDLDVGCNLGCNCSVASVCYGADTTVVQLEQQARVFDPEAYLHAVLAVCEVSAAAGA